MGAQMCQVFNVRVWLWMVFTTLYADYHPKKTAQLMGATPKIAPLVLNHCKRGVPQWWYGQSIGKVSFSFPVETVIVGVIQLAVFELQGLQSHQLPIFHSRGWKITNGYKCAFADMLVVFPGCMLHHRHKLNLEAPPGTHNKNNEG